MGLLVPADGARGIRRTEPGDVHLVNPRSVADGHKEMGKPTGVPSPKKSITTDQRAAWRERRGRSIALSLSMGREADNTTLTTVRDLTSNCLCLRAFPALFETRGCAHSRAGLAR